ncbi:hypothetical protein ACPZ19_04835 [Amycolatopsis lurida]
MLAALSVDGTPAEVPDEFPATVALEFDTDTTTHRCRACGTELVETMCGFEDEFGDTACPDSDDGPHAAERIPVSWCNSAAVHTDESGDAVTVSISVGDPRGAFTLTIRRVPDDTDGDHAGRLIMHTPYATQTTPHMELTPLHDGTFLVGAHPTATA